MNVETTVRWLRDLELIKALPQRYAMGLDTRQFEQARAVFSDDAVVEGTVRSDAIEPYFEYLTKAVSRYHATMHFMGNQLVDLDPGADRATLVTYAVAYHLEDPNSGQEDLLLGVRYQDSVVRAGTGWVIRRRTVVPQWVRGPIRSEG